MARETSRRKSALEELRDLVGPFVSTFAQKTRESIGNRVEPLSQAITQDYNAFRQRSLAQEEKRKQLIGNLTRSLTQRLTAPRVATRITAEPLAIKAQRYLEAGRTPDELIPQVPERIRRIPVLGTAAEVGREIVAFPVREAGGLASDAYRLTQRSLYPSLYGPIKYSELKSPVSRFEAQKLNLLQPQQPLVSEVRTTPQEVIGNVAGMLTYPLYLSGGRNLAGLAGPGIRQQLGRIALRGAVQGGAFGGLIGLSEGREAPDVGQQAVQALPYAAGGAIVGGILAPIVFLGGNAIRKYITEPFVRRFLTRQASLQISTTPSEVRAFANLSGFKRTARGRGFSAWLTRAADEAERSNKNIVIEGGGITPTALGKVAGKPGVSDFRITLVDRAPAIAGAEGVAPGLVPATPRVAIEPALVPPAVPPLPGAPVISAAPKVSLTPEQAYQQIKGLPVDENISKVINLVEQQRYPVNEAINLVATSNPDWAQGMGLAQYITAPSADTVPVINYIKGLDELALASDIISKEIGSPVPWVRTFESASEGMTIPERQNLLEQFLTEFREKGTTLEAFLEDKGIPKIQEIEQFNITKAEATMALGSLFNQDELQFLTRGSKDIITPEGKIARGKYYDSVIEVVEKNGKVSDKDLYHEAFHAYVDKFADPELTKATLDEIKRAFGLKTDKEAHEALAEGFADWMGGRKTFSGRILAFLEHVLNIIRGWMGRESRTLSLFNNIAQRRRVARQIAFAPEPLYRVPKQAMVVEAEPLPTNLAEVSTPALEARQDQIQKRIEAKQATKQPVDKEVKQWNEIAAELTSRTPEIPGAVVAEELGPAKPVAPTEELYISPEAQTEGIITPAPMGRVTALKTPEGKYQLKWTGTNNFAEVGGKPIMDKFNSASEARKTFEALWIKNQQAIKGVGEIKIQPIREGVKQIGEYELREDELFSGVKRVKPGEVRGIQFFVDNNMVNKKMTDIKAGKPIEPAIIKDGQVIDGYHTIEALTKLGYDDFPAVFVEGDYQALKTQYAKDFPGYSFEKVANIEEITPSIKYPDYTQVTQATVELEEIEVAEREILEEARKEFAGPSVAQVPEVAQFANIIRKAIRAYNLGKKVDDLATIAKKVPGIDEALEAIRNNGLEINTLDELAEVAKGLPKRGRIKVGKEKIQRLMAQLADAGSPLREAIRNRLLRSRTDVRKIVGPGQRVLPETKVILPQAMERIIEHQVRRMRELRKRAGITQAEFETVSEKIVGVKPTRKRGVTLEQRQKAIDLLSPESREELLTELVGVKLLAGEERAKIVKSTIENVKSESPLEPEMGANTHLLNALREVQNLQAASLHWPKIAIETAPGQFKASLEKVLGIFLPYTREQLAARLAGVDLTFHGPALAVLNLSNQFTDGLNIAFSKILKALTPDERKAVTFLTTGLRGRNFRQEFRREPTEREKTFAGYFKEIFDNHYLVANALRQAAGLKPMGKIKNYISWVIDRSIAMAARMNPRLDYTRTRTKTLAEFQAGLFSWDLEYILGKFVAASDYYFRVNLANATLKDRLKELPNQSEVAELFGKLLFEKDIYGVQGLMQRTAQVGREGVNEILGKMAWPKIQRLGPAKQKALKKTEVYAKDPTFKAMVDKGTLLVPRDMARLPNTTSALVKIMYTTKLGFGNTLFTLVNLTQPLLAVPASSLRDVAAAYVQFAKLAAFLNPGLKNEVMSALHEGGVLKYVEYGAEQVGENIDILNKVLDGTSKYLNANVVLSERAVRPIAMLAHLNYFNREYLQKGVSLSREGLLKASAELAGYTQVKAGKGYAPFILRGGNPLLTILYLFNQFPLQATDVLIRAGLITINPKEKDRLIRYAFISGNAPEEDIKTIMTTETDPQGFLTRLARLLVAAMGASTVVYLATQSFDLAKRYLPQLPIPDNPLLGLFQGAVGFVKDPVGGLEAFQDSLENFFKVAQWERIQAGAQITREGRTLEGGRTIYTVPEGEEAEWGRKVALFGKSILPQARERQELYEESLRSSKERSKKTEELLGYIQESQRLSRESGAEAGNNYLLNLPLDEKDLDRLLTLMEEEEKRIGVVERRLVGLSPNVRAGYVYKELRKIKDPVQQEQYLQRLFDQGILTEETMVELDKIFQNPPETNIFNKIFDAVNQMLGVKKVSAQEFTAPSFLTTLQQRKLEKELAPYATGVQEKMKRSADFDFVLALQDKYAGTSFGDSLIARALAERDISEEMLQYDLKTRMPDDLQTEQIIAETSGLQGEEFIASLAAMRYVSEGSRKPLLTDTVINKLEDAGHITNSLANYLKSIVWDSDKKTFTRKRITGGRRAKMKVVKTITPKYPKIKFRQQTFKPLRTQATVAKIRRPPTTRVGGQYQPRRISLQIKTALPKTISGLGKI